MKTLKKISVILMIAGAVMILGKMGDSDFNTTSVLETVRGVLKGALVMCFGKGLYEASMLIPKGAKRCKIVGFTQAKTSRCKRVA